MAAGFGMKRDNRRPCFGKCLNQIVNGFDHQMHINRHGGIRLQRCADHRAESQVRHIMIVHHVEMNQIGSRFDNFRYFLTQTGKIGG